MNKIYLNHPLASKVKCSMADINTMTREFEIRNYNNIMRPFAGYDDANDRGEAEHNQTNPRQLAPC